jgi:hypothetical protein
MASRPNPAEPPIGTPREPLGRWPSRPRNGRSRSDPPALRSHERDLEDLTRAGLSDDEAEAQMARLEQGETWAG